MQHLEPIFCFCVPDDELSTATGYHNALPLEVHGSGYTQMQMISNTKAEKLVMTSFPCSTLFKILFKVYDNYLYTYSLPL